MLVPSSIAACKGHTGVITVLVDAGADIDAVDAGGASALRFAYDAVSVEILLAAGANPNVVTRGKEITNVYTPLGKACCRPCTPDNDDFERRIGIVDVRHGVDTCFGAKLEGGPSGLLLFCAAHNGVEEFVSLLLDAGLDPNELDGTNSKMPIHAAAAQGHQAVLRLLLQRGARVDARTKHGVDCSSHCVLPFACGVRA